MRARTPGTCRGLCRGTGDLPRGFWLPLGTRPTCHVVGRDRLGATLSSAAYWRWCWWRRRWSCRAGVEAAAAGGWLASLCVAASGVDGCSEGIDEGAPSLTESSERPIPSRSCIPVGGTNRPSKGSDGQGPAPLTWGWAGIGLERTGGPSGSVFCDDGLEAGFDSGRLTPSIEEHAATSTPCFRLRVQPLTGEVGVADSGRSCVCSDAFGGPPAPS